MIGWAEAYGSYLRGGKCLGTLASRSSTKAGCMYSKLSGISRLATRLPRRLAPNCAVSLVRCDDSMTRIVSAQSRSSGVTGESASRLIPAEEVSTPSQSAKTCSAVGLRSLFLPQTNRTWCVKGSLTP